MRILFVCVGNSCRSQMAEGIAKSLGHDAASAGTHPASKVSKNALTVLQNMGIDTTGMKPKNLDLFSPENFDLVISMGCGLNARQSSWMMTGSLRTPWVSHYLFLSRLLSKLGSEYWRLNNHSSSRSGRSP